MYETRPRTAGRAQAQGTSAVLEMFWLSDHPDTGSKAASATAHGQRNLGLSLTGCPHYPLAPI